MSKLQTGGIGLGRMGNAFTKNMIEAGFEVSGYDVAAEAMSAFAAMGGAARKSPGEVAANADVIIYSLPGIAALHEVTADVAENGRRGAVVIEASTLPIPEKEAARDRLASAGIAMLDCPVSATPAQAHAKDLILFASGDEAAVEKAKPVIEAISRAYRNLGAFGNGMRMKFIANHLVAVYNAATAEALTLARKSGLDPQTTFEVIQQSAVNSRIWELRGPMMVNRDYKPGMTLDLFRKDEDLIEAFARSLDAPVPLFQATLGLYSASRAMGHGGEDTAAVQLVYEEMAGLKAD